MYSLRVSKAFKAQHYLIGGDWGPENELHSHDYTLEVRLFGDRLDEHGYLVDIIQLEAVLNALIEHYRDQTLNEKAEFAGLNPSIENFSRILSQAIGGHLQAPNLKAVEVHIHEDDIARASFRRDL